MPIQKKSGNLLKAPRTPIIGGGLGVTDIVAEYGIGDPSLNPGWDYLYFTQMYFGKGTNSHHQLRVD